MKDRLCTVTILCGFLGAGKTTLLRHLLTQTEGERWALVVNDVGSINLDARLVASEAGDFELAELGNGCVCCSNRDDLAETICRLAATSGCRRILVETTGVAEPRGIARLFVERNPFGRSVSDFAQLEALITVVDAADFRGRWLEAAPRSDCSGATRALSELQAEQIECADILIVNKCDLVEPTTQDRVEACLRGLNPRAELLRTEQAQVPREALLGRQRFDPSATLGSARWLSELNDLSGREKQQGRRPQAKRADPDYTTRYGLRSFSFQARQPFSRDKLMACLKSGFPNIIRAKGFLWLKEQPDEMCLLSLAGPNVRIDPVSWWWAARIEAGRESLDDCPPLIKALWQAPHGDRRQELVFIGVGHDEANIRRLLEYCLLPTNQTP